MDSSQGHSVSHDNFRGLKTSVSRKAETDRLNKRKSKGHKNEGACLPLVKLSREQFPPQNRFQTQQFPSQYQYPNKQCPSQNQYSNQQFALAFTQFQNQQFPSQYQYPNQQFPSQNRYPNQQCAFPSTQFQNQQFPSQYQHSNQQFPSQNQYSIQQFALPYAQFQNQQFPSQYQYSNQQFPSQNQYSNQQFASPSTQFQTQFPQNTKILNKPFSQYKTLSPSTPRSSRSTESPPINDEVEVVKVTKEVRQYTKAEDICLAKAYVRGTKDPVHWNEIKLHHNKLAAVKGLKLREAKSLKNRMSRMKGEMVMYNEAIAHVKSTHNSRKNEAVKMTKVNEKFEQLNKKFKNSSFKFQHVVDILNQCSKFNHVTTRSNISRYEGTNSSPSNNSRDSPNIGSHASTEQSREYHSGEKRSRCSVEASEEGSSPIHPPRPIVNKAAAKLQANKGKRKVGEASNQSLNVLTDLSHERTSYYQEVLSNKKQAHAQKLKVMQKSVENEKRKLELDRDMRIMSIDVNSLASEEEKEQMLNLRSKILAKWQE